MRYIFKLALLYTLSTFFISCSSKPEKVLLFSKTVEFRHTSIESSIQSLTTLLSDQGIQVVSTEDAKYFQEDSLKQYSAVIFLNTTGDVLNTYQQIEFERYIQSGGGFVGIHAATDTEYNWPWYNQLVGAYFNGHPAIQDAVLQVMKKEDACCQHLPDAWTVNEEWYNFKSISDDIEVLVNIDESSYEGGTNGDDHPIVWRHNFDGGRAFYTALGHKAETFDDPLYQQQILAGIHYAIGPNKLNYSKARTQKLLDENRFSKVVLDFNLAEPMELDELGDRGIIYVERKGAIKLYDYEEEKSRVLDSLKVHYADEDGLLGIAVDPNYNDNHWIYLFYSPDLEEPIQHISRFTLKGDKLEDEKIMLTVPIIRKCCHSGGSLEFDKEGLLYIGIGDNTNPFESSGFAPIDEREGRELFDAQRSASNTNDLRGKILRIRPEADGTYSIPEGNLFPEGTPNCRPEIYLMGLRNPFRFSIDSKNNYVYWGDIGPDSGNNDSLRGPQGMGEFNQAQKPGYYGWPYSRGNNQMYVDYDFSTEKSGKSYDPQRIINDSPNNTGIDTLPAIEESMIWYGYASSKRFPWLGDGGVNPMSGPVFHRSDFNITDNTFPNYFENKWFIYEWMRDWIYVVHLDENQNFVQADPFMSNTEFSHPMDMMFSKDGQMYILEYGQKWFSKNMDARLSLIKYNPGNRAPIAKFQIDKLAGAAPLKIKLDASDSHDPDNKISQYIWSIENKKITHDQAVLDYTFENPGHYDIELRVIDKDGEYTDISQSILVGNEIPSMSINVDNSNRMYTAYKSINYNISINDKEDGSSDDSTFDDSKVKVTWTYIPEGEDLILANVGHQENITPEGLQLINDSDCKACHAVDAEVAGPSYQAIANRYGKKDRGQMIQRVIKGSQGIWGERMMSAHPQLSIDQVGKMADYILSLKSNNNKEVISLPLKGTLKFDQHQKDNISGQYVLMASYADNGHPDVSDSELSVIEKIVFSPPRIELESLDELDKDLGIWESQGRGLVGSIKDGKHIKIKDISYDKLKAISLGAAFSKEYPYFGNIQIRKGSPTGSILGSYQVDHLNNEKDEFKIFEIPLKPSTGVDDLYLLFINKKDKEQYTLNGDWVQFEYD